MYNCYNEAIAHMIKTYGEVKTPMSKFNSSTASTYKKDNLDDDGKHIDLLLDQYYLGTAPKKELFYKLVSLNVISLTEA